MDRRSSVSCRLRSIPAHAGEPPHSTAGRSKIPLMISVYPRPRGGARTSKPSTFLPGLSPPTRGSHARDIGHETPGGLSPPTRGSRAPTSFAVSYFTERSIPAHAGEPLVVTRCNVYA